MVYLCPSFFYNKNITEIVNIIDAFMIFFF